VNGPDGPPSLDAYALRQGGPALSRRSGPKWSAGYELDESGAGTLTTGPTTDDAPVWADVFAHWQLDPALFEIVGDVTANAWEGPSADGPVVFRQFKAKIRRRQAGGVPVDDLLRKVARWRPGKTARPERATGAAFVVTAADWQVGGEPAARFVDKFERTLDGLWQTAKAARRDGCDRLVICFAGDMVEGVTGNNYPAQLHTTGAAGLTMRDQVRLVRQCETQLVRKLAPLFAETTAVGLPGNHGRTAAKVVTRPDDNLDLMAFESCADVLRESGFADEYAVTFIAAEPAGVVTVDAAGFRLAFAHGDQISGSADRVRDYWRRVAFTRHGDTDLADALITGHRHHFRVEELAVGRWMFVAPTLGGESDWFTESGGGTSRPGTLTFRCAADDDGPDWWALHLVTV
jgi:hypothetical protein